MRESDARKDGGTYGEHTTQHDEDRYQDEPEGKREDCDKTIITASDNCVCGLPKSQHQAQAAPAPECALPYETAAQWTQRLRIALFDERDKLATVARELAETRAACDALAEALRYLAAPRYEGQPLFHEQTCRGLNWRIGTDERERDCNCGMATARAALAQWEEAKK